jgi:hypothetical protein
LASLPAFVVLFTWRFHVASELTGREAGFLPFDSWHFSHIPTILLQMLITLMKKGYYLVLITIIIVLSVRALLKCEQPIDRLLLLTGFLVVGYNAFLFLIYVSSFSEADALRVASYWRYNMHMGGIVIAASGVVAVLVWHRFFSRETRWKKMAWIPIILLVASPFAFAKKLRFDLDPIIVHYRYVGSDLSNYMSQESMYFVLDPEGSGEAYNITTYEMDGLGKAKGYLAAYHKIDHRILESVVSANRLTHILVHSVNPMIEKFFPVNLSKDSSQLLKKTKNGWSVVAKWKRPR